MERRERLSLSQPVRYEIRVLGEVDPGWFDVDEQVNRIEYENGPVMDRATSIIGTFDQAALIGLLRRLYGFGLPLISVSRIGDGHADASAGHCSGGTAAENEGSGAEAST